jgi:hypothetical protein
MPVAVASRSRSVRVPSLLTIAVSVADPPGEMVIWK